MSFLQIVRRHDPAGTHMCIRVTENGLLLRAYTSVFARGLCARVFTRTMRARAIRSEICRKPVRRRVASFDIRTSRFGSKRPRGKQTSAGHTCTHVRADGQETSETEFRKCFLSFAELYSSRRLRHWSRPKHFLYIRNRSRVSEAVKKNDLVRNIYSRINE